MWTQVNPLNPELNHIRHLLALEGARHIVHVSRIRVKPCLHSENISIPFSVSNKTHRATDNFVFVWNKRFKSHNRPTIWCFFKPMVRVTFKQTNKLSTSLTLWSRAFLEKLTGPQIIKNFRRFYGNFKFSTASTRAQHLCLYLGGSVHSKPFHPTSWKTILIFFLQSTPRSPKWSLLIRAPHLVGQHYW